jgi:hypothetical protein
MLLAETKKTAIAVNYNKQPVAGRNLSPVPLKCLLALDLFPRI